MAEQEWDESDGMSASEENYQINLYLAPSGQSFSDIAIREKRLLVDTAVFDATIERISELGDWSKPPYSPSGAQKLAWRIANRIARRHARAWQIPDEVLAKALLLPVWTEVRTFLACRQIARALATEGYSRFLLPLQSTRFSCFNYWGESDVARLYLAHELQRRGLDAAFVSDEVETRSGIDFTFVPSKAIRPLVQLWPLGFGRKTSVLICEAGIRQSQMKLARAEAAKPLRQHHATRRSLFGDALFSSFHRPRQAQLTVSLAKVDKAGDSGRYTGHLPSDFIKRILGAFWADPAQKGWKNALALIKKRQTKEVLVCDHHFFESAITAGAVKELGGRVTLLPHSSVPVHLTFRTPDSFDAAVAVTEEGAKRWAAAFADKEIESRPGIMLPPFTGEPHFDSSERLTVVMIGGAHRLGGLPLMKIPTHKQTWRDFLAVPESLQEKIRLVFKPKSGWEDQDWFEREFPASTRSVECLIEKNSIADLKHPNMVFVCMTTASSAILEGIAEGIPTLIASDQTAENYIPVESSPVAIQRPKEIWTQINSLTSATEYKKLASDQMNWARALVHGDTNALTTRSR